MGKLEAFLYINKNEERLEKIESNEIASGRKFLQLTERLDGDPTIFAVKQKKTFKYIIYGPSSVCIVVGSVLLYLSTVHLIYLL